jgi:hypothetical protein
MICGALFIIKTSVSDARDYSLSSISSPFVAGWEEMPESGKNSCKSWLKYPGVSWYGVFS